jgi:hypothetical protein
MEIGTTITFYQNFVEYDKAVKTTMAELEQVAKTEAIHLLFGPSKAGKSAYLARILENTSSKRFCLALENSNTATSEGGIQVGLGPASMTKVPYLRAIDYQGKRVDVMDFPGFLIAFPWMKR